MYSRNVRINLSVRAVPDEQRLTKYGKFLRSTSIDEVLELLNILEGDSGIIGTTKKNLDFTRVSLA